MSSKRDGERDVERDRKDRDRYREDSAYRRGYNDEKERQEREEEERRRRNE